MTDSVHDEIKKGEIIKASSIFEKFKALFQPLLDKAKSNCDALKDKIAAINGQDSIISDYYTFEKNNLENVFNELKRLEENWKDVDSTWESHCPLSESEPLHLKKRDVIPASGKVRKFDYIAAYNFKGYLQALYGIASELRNIAFRVYEDGEFKPGYSFGNNDRFESYTDLSLLGDVTDSYIPLNVENSNIFSFQDYIINNNTNGDIISVQNDLPGRKTPHGFSDDENNLIPNSIMERASRKEYINSNIKEVSNTIYEFGRQTTNHLQKDGVPTSTPSSLLDNYYNVPSRTDSYNKAIYQSNPKTGVAFEYLTLKPAGAYNTTTNDLISSSFSEVSSDISTYLYTKTPNDNDKILSTPQNYQGKRQIVRAETVNNLYKELNTLFVKISASLCGEYRLDFSRSQIPIYTSPKGGLGYPEIFSWYFSHWTSVKKATRYYFLCNTVPSGSGDSYTIVTCNNDVEGNPNIGQEYSIESKGDITSMRKVAGLLNNGKIIAREEISQSKPSIRNGLFWFNFDNIDYSNNSYNKKLSLDDFKSTLVANAYTSVIPMTFNNRIIKEASSHETTEITNKDFWKSVKMSSNADSTTIPSTAPSADYKIWTFTKKKGILPFDKNTIELSALAYREPNKQLFNRNCISYPLEISSYLFDTLTANESELSAININNKYIFTPSLNWWNYLACENQTYNIYNGRIPNYNSNTTKRVTIGTGNQHLNPAAGIPVIYDSRENVWNPQAIVKSPAHYFDNIGVNDPDITSLHYGTIQLLLNKNRSKDTQQYMPIDKNFKINWFEYSLKCGISINEANDTHNGKMWSEFTIFNSDITNNRISRSISTSYYLKNEGSGFPPSPQEKGGDDQQEAVITSQTSNISSYIYHGYNNYNVKDYSKPEGREISNYLKSGLVDMMEILYGTRFKFNDFYETGNPLTMNGMKVDDIQDFFTAGGSNKYAQGYATKCINWVTRVSSNVQKTQFNVLQYLYQYHNGDDLNPSDKPALAAGNFFIGGNQSNAVNCVNDENENQTFYYYIAPQPDPISATEISMNTSDKSFRFNGACNCFWNDISCIKVNLYKKNGGSSTFSLTNSEGYYPLSYNRPYRKNTPKKVIQLKYGSRTVVTATRENNDPYYTINIALPISDESIYESELSCTLRFYNENRGFRDVCQSKNTSDIDDGAFKIYVPEFWNITFNSNGGTGTMNADSIIKNFKYTLPACGFSKTDYRFGGWLVPGNPNPIVKNVGDEININANTEITAQWNPIEPTE